MRIYLGEKEKAILFCLKAGDEELPLSQNALSLETQISLSSISRILSELESDELVMKVNKYSRASGRRTNSYLILPAGISACERGYYDNNVNADLSLADTIQELKDIAAELKVTAELVMDTRQMITGFRTDLAVIIELAKKRQLEPEITPVAEKKPKPIKPLHYVPWEFNSKDVNYKQDLIVFCDWYLKTDKDKWGKRECEIFGGSNSDYIRYTNDHFPNFNAEVPDEYRATVDFIAIITQAEILNVSAREALVKLMENNNV